MAAKNTALAPTWVPADQQRRLAAYKILAAYLNNVARWFLDGTTAADDRREYGDPALLVARIVSALLGDDPEVVVDGAAVDPYPALPPRPPGPDDLPGDATDIERRVAEVAVARWERDAEQVVAEWTAAVEAQPARAERERWLRGQADDAGAWAALRLVEADACGLGDGVAVHSWSSRDRRVVVRHYDPGFYFPVHGDGDDNPPTAVHLAWQYDVETTGGRVDSFVRRLTWELVPVWAAYVDEQGRPTGAPLDARDTDRDGVIRRRYPWHNADDPGSEMMCVYSDGTWKLSDLGTRRVADLSPDAAVWAAKRADTGLDFIPVTHHQGVDVGHQFGASVLAVVAQLLDEIAAVDTDASTSASFAAGPVVAISSAFIDDGDPVGWEAPDAVGRGMRRINAPDGETVLRVRPGVVFELGENGRMDVVDMAGGLEAIDRHVDGLLERLSVNAQVPGEMLGRVDPGKVLSGVAIGLRLGPFRQFVEALRLVHVPVWAEWLSMWQRVAMAAGPELGGLEAGEVFRARVVPGGFLPHDMAALVEMVARARAAGIVSEEQAVALLVDGGMSIEDAAGEVARIRAADPERAKALFEATGNEDAVAAWAGVEVADSPDPDVGAGGGGS